MRINILTIDAAQNLNLVNFQLISGDQKAYQDCLQAHKKELKALINSQ